MNATGLERLLHRPIFGGVFGHGRFALASMPCVSRGLHSIRYLVVEPQAGMVLSVSDDKTEALAGARRVLTVASELQPVEEPHPEQLKIWPDWNEPVLEVEPLKQEVAKTVSRRRREIFDKSNGKCHYCGNVLALDGKWHVEHMQPRALGGTEDLLNLVAACAGCNLEKSDRTALEFVALASR
jgi:hypothetical protein